MPIGACDLIYARFMTSLDLGLVSHAKIETGSGDLIRKKIPGERRDRP